MRRSQLHALRSAFLHVYGLNRKETEHILDSFPVIRKYDERDFSEYRTKCLVLEAYDRMTDAIDHNGRGWNPWLTCLQDRVRVIIDDSNTGPGSHRAERSPPGGPS